MKINYDASNYINIIVIRFVEQLFNILVKNVIQVIFLKYDKDQQENLKANLSLLIFKMYHNIQC